MRKDVVAPSVGESITEVSILKWAKNHGQAVKTGELLLEIESDKATVEIVAEHSGVLQITKQAGERIPIGATIGYIDDELTATGTLMPPKAPSAPAPSATPPPISPPPGAPSMSPPPMSPPPMAAAPSAPPPLSTSMSSSAPSMSSPSSYAPPSPPPVAHSAPAGLSPAVRRASAELGVNTANLAGSGKDGRVTKGDVLGAAANGSHSTSSSASMNGAHASAAASASTSPSISAPPAGSMGIPLVPTSAKSTYVDKPGDRRVPMSMLRAKIAERLVQAQHTAAILTTFNEVDMTAIMKLRAEHKDAFKAKHGVNLSFMSFFTKASIAALKLIPEVNAAIDGKDVIYHDYFDIGIAVGTDRGLVVPVIRNADQLDFVGIEKKMGELAVKARDGKLSMADMSGGTFTISNGGTYGSLMSTPILNMPQSGILGMHKIMDRPMAVNGKVEIRPMMYLALSYDHRLIDGKGAVTWLVQLKEHLENPEKLGFTY